jgi:hypothetical protein
MHIKVNIESGSILLVGSRKSLVIGGEGRGVEGDFVALIVELDVGDEPFVEQVRTDDGGADLHTILVPLHHLLLPVHHYPHLHFARNYRPSSTADALLPHHPILGEVGDALCTLMRFLVIATALADDAH